MNAFILSECGYFAGFENASVYLCLEFDGLIMQSAHVFQDVEYSVGIRLTLRNSLAEPCQLRKYNYYCLIKQIVCVFFSKCIFGNVAVFPALCIRVFDLRAHQSDKVYRRDIIVLSLAVLSVVCPAGVADAPLEPVVLMVPLHFNDEDSAGGVRTHEVKLEILAVVQNRTMMFCRQIADLHYTTVLGKKYIHYRHDYVLVGDVTE